MKKVALFSSSPTDAKETQRAYEVMDDVLANLAEIERRYQRYIMKMAIRYGLLFLIGLSVSYLALRGILWMLK
jgi:hypothetical protein